MKFDDSKLNALRDERSTISIQYFHESWNSKSDLQENAELELVVLSPGKENR